jgi:hypothetical protein
LTNLFFTSFSIFIQPALSTLTSRAVTFTIRARGINNLGSFICRFLENDVRSKLGRTAYNSGF